MPLLPDPLPANRAIRAGWLMLGLFFVALGIIGAILPLMPTTIFLILAAGCFARSSPRLESWLLNHARFGPTLRAWRAEKAIPQRAKIAACTGMAIGYAIFLIGARPGWPLGLLVAAIMAGCAAYVVSRPSPRADPRSD
jgi:uncharacterized membrane protein YbaN (DUF454 family)